MDTIHAANFVDLLRSLPAQGTAREIGLQRLTDIYADAEARSALDSAAAHAGAGPANRVLGAASAACTGRSDIVQPGSPVSSREQLRAIVATPEFLADLPAWIRELRAIAVTHPGTGACTVATAMHLWRWTMTYVQTTLGERTTAVAELSDVFGPLVAARALILDIAARSRDGEDRGAQQFRSDLSHVQAARAAAEAGTACAELVFGYRRHLAWDAEGCASCYGGDELDELEGLIPGIASGARAHSDVIEADGSHAAKAGPCARVDGVETFARIRGRLDACLTGSRLAKDRAAAALPRVLAGSALG